VDLLIIRCEFMNRVSITAWKNSIVKVSKGNKTGVDFAKGEKKLVIFSKSIPSPARTTAPWGSRNIGNLISIPAIRSSNRLAGFFCLNISITDMGSISFDHLLMPVAK
jgi:hypothetical protein